MIRIHPEYQQYPRLGNQLFIHAFARYLGWKMRLPYSGFRSGNLEVPNTDAPDRQTGSVTIHDVDAPTLLTWSADEPNLPSNIELAGYFQQPELLHDVDYAMYLREAVRINGEREYPGKDDFFVHVRAGDIGNDSRMLPFEHYESMISNNVPAFGNGWLATDTPNHPTCQRLMEEFQLNLVNKGPEDTIIFGAGFQHVVTSLGSFSFWIGMLSYGKVYGITMDEAVEAYGTKPWHPSYDLEKIKTLGQPYQP